jgi:hypothetical protein
MAKGKKQQNTSPININDMDLTMCYTNEVKAHIWHETKNTKQKIHRVAMRKIENKTKKKTIPAVKKKSEWVKKGKGKGEAGRQKQKQKQKRSKTTATAKEMPIKNEKCQDYFLTKWKVLFNIIVPCLPEERFSAFSLPFAIASRRRAKQAMILRDVEAKKRREKKHTQNPYFILQQ